MTSVRSSGFIFDIFVPFGLGLIGCEFSDGFGSIPSSQYARRLGFAG